MNKRLITSANQRSKYNDRSTVFKAMHRANKGIIVSSNKVVQTNLQKIITSPIQQGTGPSEAVSNEIDFNNL